MNKIFTKDRIEAKLQIVLSDALSKIQNLDPEVLLGIGERKYTNFLLENYKLQLPELDFGKVSRSEKSIKDPNRSVIRGSNFQSLKFILQLTYHVPLEGAMSYLDNSPLILYKPSLGAYQIENASYNGKEIVIKRLIPEDIDFNTLKEEKDELQKLLYSNYGRLLYDVNQFNNDLKNSIENKFTEILNRHLRSKQILEKLGVPLRREEETKLHVRPKLRKKIDIPKLPKSVLESIDPFITKHVYEDIIGLIHDACRNIERMPSMFRGRSENDLRDFILFVLDPNFILGSATGETFNAEGKTDILLRYSSSNVFVAECKYWHGTSSYLKAIDQLLSYLTWRDSKTALIIFVRNKSISQVLDKVKLETKCHSNYVSFEAELGEGLLRFKFHLNGDDNKEVWVTVMIYHTVQDDKS